MGNEGSVGRSHREGITLRQLETLVQLYAGLQELEVQSSMSSGKPGVKIPTKDRNRLDRLAVALGHDKAAHRPSGGEPLLEGTVGNWRLTGLGAEVARRAKLALHDVDWVVDAATATGVNGDAIGFTCLPAHLVRYQKVLLSKGPLGSPQLNPVEVGASHRSDGGVRMAALLETGRVLLAIGPAKLAVPPHIESAVLYSSSLRVVRDVGTGSRRKSSSLAGEQVSVSDLSGYQIAVAPVGHQSRSLLDAACLRSGVRLIPAMELSDVVALRAVSDGVDRISVVPDDSFETPVPADWPYVVDSDGCRLSYDHWLYLDTRRGLPEKIRHALLTVASRLHSFESTRG